MMSDEYPGALYLLSESLSIGLWEADWHPLQYSRCANTSQLNRDIAYYVDLFTVYLD